MPEEMKGLPPGPIPGTTFFVGRSLGSGGFASVYHMYDRKTNTSFAGKFLPGISMRSKSSNKDEELTECQIHAGLCKAFAQYRSGIVVPHRIRNSRTVARNTRSETRNTRNVTPTEMEIPELFIPDLDIPETKIRKFEDLGTLIPRFRSEYRDRITGRKLEWCNYVEEMHYQMRDLLRQEATWDYLPDFSKIQSEESIFGKSLSSIPSIQGNTDTILLSPPSPNLQLKSVIDDFRPKTVQNSSDLQSNSASSHTAISSNTGLVNNTVISNTSSDKLVSLSSCKNMNDYLRCRGEIRSIVPKIYGCLEVSSSDGSGLIILQELLGKTLADIRKAKTRISMSMGGYLGMQLIKSMQEIHSHGVLHRDIKPQNLLLGNLYSNRLDIHIVDFGLAKRLDPKIHIVEREVEQDTSSYNIGGNQELNNQKPKHLLRDFRKPGHTDFRGTAAYASIRALQRLESSRRDDVEGCFWVLFDLLFGGLPWRSKRWPPDSKHSFWEEEFRVSEVKRRMSLYRELFKPPNGAPGSVPGANYGATGCHAGAAGCHADSVVIRTYEKEIRTTYEPAGDENVDSLIVRTVYDGIPKSTDRGNGSADREKDRNPRSADRRKDRSVARRGGESDRASVAQRGEIDEHNPPLGSSANDSAAKNNATANDHSIGRKRFHPSARNGSRRSSSGNHRRTGSSNRHNDNRLSRRDPDRERDRSRSRQAYRQTECQKMNQSERRNSSNHSSNNMNSDRRSERQNRRSNQRSEQQSDQRSNPRSNKLGSQDKGGEDLFITRRRITRLMIPRARLVEEGLLSKKRLVKIGRDDESARHKQTKPLMDEERLNPDQTLAQWIAAQALQHTKIRMDHSPVQNANATPIQEGGIRNGEGSSNQSASKRPATSSNQKRANQTNSASKAGAHGSGRNESGLTKYETSLKRSRAALSARDILKIGGTTDERRLEEEDTKKRKTENGDEIETAKRRMGFEGRVFPRGNDEFSDVFERKNANIFDRKNTTGNVKNENVTNDTNRLGGRIFDRETDTNMANGNIVSIKSTTPARKGDRDKNIVLSNSKGVAREPAQKGSTVIGSSKEFQFEGIPSLKSSKRRSKESLIQLSEGCVKTAKGSNEVPSGGRAAKTASEKKRRILKGTHNIVVNEKVKALDTQEKKQLIDGWNLEKRETERVEKMRLEDYYEIHYIDEEDLEREIRADVEEAAEGMTRKSKIRQQKHNHILAEKVAFLKACREVVNKELIAKEKEEEKEEKKRKAEEKKRKAEELKRKAETLKTKEKEDRRLLKEKEKEKEKEDRRIEKEKKEKEKEAQKERKKVEKSPSKGARKGKSPGPVQINGKGSASSSAAKSDNLRSNSAVSSSSVKASSPGRGALQNGSTVGSPTTARADNSQDANSQEVRGIADKPFVKPFVTSVNFSQTTIFDNSNTATQRATIDNSNTATQRAAIADKSKIVGNKTLSEKAVFAYTPTAKEHLNVMESNIYVGKSDYMKFTPMRESHLRNATNFKSHVQKLPVILLKAFVNNYDCPFNAQPNYLEIILAFRALFDIGLGEIRTDYSSKDSFLKNGFNRCKNGSQYDSQSHADPEFREQVRSDKTKDTERRGNTKDTENAALAEATKPIAEKLHGLTNHREGTIMQKRFPNIAIGSATDVHTQEGNGIPIRTHSMMSLLSTNADTNADCSSASKETASKESLLETSKVFGKERSKELQTSEGFQTSAERSVLSGLLEVPSVPSETFEIATLRKEEERRTEEEAKSRQEMERKLRQEEDDPFYYLNEEDSDYGIKFRRFFASNTPAGTSLWDALSIELYRSCYGVEHEEWPKNEHGSILYPEFCSYRDLSPSKLPNNQRIDGYTIKDDEYTGQLIGGRIMHAGVDRKFWEESILDSSSSGEEEDKDDDIDDDMGDDVDDDDVDDDMGDDDDWSDFEEDEDEGDFDFDDPDSEDEDPDYFDQHSNDSGADVSRDQVSNHARRNYATANDQSRQWIARNSPQGYNNANGKYATGNQNNGRGHAMSHGRDSRDNERNNGDTNGQGSLNTALVSGRVEQDPIQNSNENRNEHRSSGRVSVSNVDRGNNDDPVKHRNDQFDNRYDGDRYDQHRYGVRYENKRSSNEKRRSSSRNREFAFENRRATRSTSSSRNREFAFENRRATRSTSVGNSGTARSNSVGNSGTARSNSVGNTGATSGRDGVGTCGGRSRHRGCENRRNRGYDDSNYDDRRNRGHHERRHSHEKRDYRAARNENQDYRAARSAARNETRDSRDVGNKNRDRYRETKDPLRDSLGPYRYGGHEPGLVDGRAEEIRTDVYRGNINRVGDPNPRKKQTSRQEQAGLKRNGYYEEERLPTPYDEFGTNTGKRRRRH